MVKTIITSIVCGALLGLAPSTHADEDIGLRVCEYVKANDKSRLRSYMKQKNIKIRNIYDMVQCNGMNLMVFAASNQALEAGEFLIGKIPSKKVAAEIDNIAQYSAHLAENARARVK